ncbi:MAG: DNA polymerase I [Gammaproteobacteria bacterium]
MPMKIEKTLVLVDGSSYLYRAFHALPPLTNSKGQATGAIYGVINMLKKLQHTYNTKQFAVVFDAKGKTFRDDLYPQYKANRPPMPDDLVTQIAPLHAIIRAMGIPLIEKLGVEADDIIGTLAEMAKNCGWRTVISTGDKDMAQLVDDHIQCVNTMTDSVFDASAVKLKFGVMPDGIIDYLALVGDSVDNVPGVPKVGPKTAVKWLTEYGSVENIIAHANDIKGKVGENLRASLESLLVSKELVTIRKNIDLDLTFDDLRCTEKNVSALKDLFTELEFKTWLRDILEEGNMDKIAITHYDVVRERAAFDEWVKKLKEANLFAFDTETTALNYCEARIVGVSFALEPGKAAYVPFGHDYEDAPQQLSESEVLDTLKPLLEDPLKKKIGHHLKYDKNVLANHSINLQGIAFDSMLESYVLNSAAFRHDMDTLALKYLSKKTISFEEVAGKGAKQKTFNQISLDTAGPYAAEDADITLQLHEKLWPEIKKEKTLQWIFSTIEMPLVPVLSDIECTGVLVDANLLRKQSEGIALRMKALEDDVFQQVGHPFNLSSTQQLQTVLFDEMGLPVLAKTPKGAPSTAEPVLQELAHDYELPHLILEYRSLSKLKSTYTDKLPQQINDRTGRVHTSYHQAVTATGRLSSSDPNLQNIPVKTEEGRRIREAFIAPSGYKIVSADYSQIELRIIAHLSQDDGLIDAFKKGLDIHRATAAEVMGIALEAVSAEERRWAKAINFGLIYGMSAFGLSKQLETDRKTAQFYMDQYFARYPGVKRYMDDIRQLVRQQGFVETLWGRRLYLPEIHSKNKMQQMAAERAAVNAPMQGTAADIIKKAMITIHEGLKEKAWDAKMIMQVHDELVFEVKKEQVDALKAYVEITMCEAITLSIPLEVSVGVGDNWNEAH